MTCCDYGRCTDGDKCPVRRIRAGGPPPDDLPIQYAEDDEYGIIDWAAVARYAALIVALFCLAMAGAVLLVGYR